MALRTSRVRTIVILSALSALRVSELIELPRFRPPIVFPHLCDLMSMGVDPKRPSRPQQ